MTWTYIPAEIGTTALYQVRWLIGDTLSKDQQVQDEEIGWSMTQRTSVYGVAADCCRSIAARLSREADSSEGTFHTMYSQRARNYRAMAASFEVQASVRSAGLPYSGQLSHTDYDLMTSDPDRINPAFAIGMMDDYLPVGPIDSLARGNQ